MYTPQDPPLVLHMLTSWQPAVQPVTCPHASAELDSDSNRQSPGHKTNALTSSVLLDLYMVMFEIQRRLVTVVALDFVPALRKFTRNWLK